MFLITGGTMVDAETLFAAHRDGVFRYLCRVVGAAEAKELTQEVFLRVARGPLPHDDGTGCRAWVFTIARNLALNHVRDDRRRGTSLPLHDTAVGATQELALSVREALDGLQPVDRDVFLMREAGGLTYQEISVACGLTADAVRSRLHRARQQLRAALGPRLGDEQGRHVRLYDGSD